MPGGGGRPDQLGNWVPTTPKNESGKVVVLGGHTKPEPEFPGSKVPVLHTENVVRPTRHLHVGRGMVASPTRVGPTEHVNTGVFGSVTGPYGTM